MATFTIQMSKGSTVAVDPVTYMPAARNLVFPGRQSANMDSFQEVIETCNKFQGDVADLWGVYVCDHPRPIGYMLDEFRRQFNWAGSGFSFCKGEARRVRRVHLNPAIGSVDDAIEVCRRKLVQFCERNAQDRGFREWLQKSEFQRDYHLVRGLCKRFEGLKVPAPLRGIIGIVTTGTHMNMFTMKEVAGQKRVYLWVSKRSGKVTYGHKLDQVVAGAMSPEDGMDDLKTLQREAKEEAGLYLDMSTYKMRDKNGAVVGEVKKGSEITFYDQKDAIAGTEVGHLEPGIRFTYDIEVQSDFVPVPTEPDAIDGFHLKSLEIVKEDLKNAEWKPNSGLVMLDFLLRKQLVEADELEVAVLQARLRRKIDLDM